MLITFLNSSCKNCVVNVGKKWTFQMLIPQYLVLVLKLFPIYTVSLNTVFLILQNRCYMGTPCIWNSQRDATLVFQFLVQFLLIISTLVVKANAQWKSFYCFLGLIVFKDHREQIKFFTSLILHNGKIFGNFGSYKYKIIL